MFIKHPLSHHNHQVLKTNYELMKTHKKLQGRLAFKILALLEIQILLAFLEIQILQVSSHM